MDCVECVGMCHRSSYGDTLGLVKLVIYLFLLFSICFNPGRHAAGSLMLQVLGPRAKMWLFALFIFSIFSEQRCHSLHDNRVYNSLTSYLRIPCKWLVIWFECEAFHLARGDLTRDWLASLSGETAAGSSGLNKWNLHILVSEALPGQGQEMLHGLCSSSFFFSTCYDTVCAPATLKMTLLYISSPETCCCSF